jgi:TonB family protein
MPLRSLQPNQCYFPLAALFVFILPVFAAAAPRVAVLSFGESDTGRRATERLVSGLAGSAELSVIDSDQSAVAARGAGYNGSLNLSLEEARNLGAAIGCNFFALGDAQTIRRSSSSRPKYYEAYASIFIVNSRTGKLVLWERLHSEDALPEVAETSLLDVLRRRSPAYSSAITKAAEADVQERLANNAQPPVIYEDAPDDEKAAAESGIRLPQPYRRLRPEYPVSAAEADAEATVDLRVNIGIDGEVANIEVVRWAGFGLDDAAINTVRKLHFRPATRNGAAFPVRVLLRYNFRRPAKEEQ